MRRPILLLLMAWLLPALSACYTVKSSVPGHIKTIGIPIFRNETLQSGIEDEVTQEIIARFQRNGTLSIAEPGVANALLEGTVSGYDNRVFRFNDREQAQEYIVAVTLDVTVRDRVRNRELWSQKGIRTTATYLLSGAQARSEADARKDAVQQAADILLSRTVEGW